MKKWVLIVFLSFFACRVFAQKGNKEVYYGNKAFQKGDFTTAVAQYEKALKLAPGNQAARINLALAQSKMKKVDAAVKNYDAALANSKDLQRNAMINYDKGTTLAQNKKYEEAIKSFENTLRTSPEDGNARENLQKAINELKKQQQKNQDKNQNKNQKQPPPPPKKDNKSQQNNQHQPQDQHQNQGMSKQQAEQYLKALRQQERETQKKLQGQKAGGGTPPNGKDW